MTRTTTTAAAAAQEAPPATRIGDPTRQTALQLTAATGVMKVSAAAHRNQHAAGHLRSDPMTPVATFEDSKSDMMA